MAFHHVALATKDSDATHAFYTEVMGFRLVKVVVTPTPTTAETGGWSKHFFFDTGNGEMIAFWELHDDGIGTDFPTDLNESLGLPVWVNHLAFDAPSRDDLDRHRRRWVDHGITVAEVDHDFCVSIYATDPNGIMVEFCHTTRPFTPAELAAAADRLVDPAPTMDRPGRMTLHRPAPVPVSGA